VYGLGVLEKGHSCLNFAEMALIFQCFEGAYYGGANCQKASCTKGTMNDLRHPKP
jgi:hypothetical protein